MPFGLISDQYRIPPYLIYTMYISRDFKNIGFFACLPLIARWDDSLLRPATAHQNQIVLMFLKRKHYCLVFVYKKAATYRCHRPTKAITCRDLCCQIYFRSKLWSKFSKITARLFGASEFDNAPCSKLRNISFQSF